MERPLFDLVSESSGHEDLFQQQQQQQQHVDDIRKRRAAVAAAKAKQISCTVAPSSHPDVVAARAVALVAEHHRQEKEVGVASHQLWITSASAIHELIVAAETIGVSVAGGNERKVSSDEEEHSKYVSSRLVDIAAHEELEREFVLNMMCQEQNRSIAMAGFILVAMIAEGIRNFPVLMEAARPRHASTLSAAAHNASIAAFALAFFAFLDFSALLFIWLQSKKRIRFHDEAVERRKAGESACPSGTSLLMTRSQLRRLADRLEYWTAVCIALNVAFCALHVSAESQCPFVEGNVAMEFFCRSSPGFALSSIITALSLPSVLTPIRRHRLLPTIVIVALLGVLLIGTMTPTGSSDADGVTKRSDLYLPRIQVFLIKACGITLYAVLAVILRWRQERQEREKFAMVCITHIVRVEQRLSSDFLSKQIVSSIPQHVARRMLAGERVVDHYDNGILIGFSIPNFSMIYSRIGTADVVDLLNRTFSNIDTALAAFPQIMKMQTIGDRYMCIVKNSLHEDLSQFTPQSAHMHVTTKQQQVDIARSAAEVMHKSVASHLSNRSVVLHVGSFSCVIFGRSMAYVAVGKAVDALFDVWMPIARGVVQSKSFAALVARLESQSSASETIGMPHSNGPSSAEWSESIEGILEAVLMPLSTKRPSLEKETTKAAASAVHVRDSKPEELHIHQYLTSNGATFEDPEVEAHYGVHSMIASVSPFPLAITVLTLI